MATIKVKAGTRKGKTVKAHTRNIKGGSAATKKGAGAAFDEAAHAMHAKNYHEAGLKRQSFQDGTSVKPGYWEAEAHERKMLKHFNKSLAAKKKTLPKEKPVKKSTAKPIKYKKAKRDNGYYMYD